MEEKGYVRLDKIKREQIFLSLKVCCSGYNIIKFTHKYNEE